MTPPEPSGASPAGPVGPAGSRIGGHDPPLRTRPPRSVALVLLSAIGDAVHAMPVVHSLRAAWPDARLTWAIQPAAHALVAGHPDVSEFVIFERRRGARAFGDFHRRVRGRRFDLVVAPQVYLKAGLLTAMLHAPVKLGFDRRRARDLNWLFTSHRIPPHPPQHVQDQYFEFLEALRVPVRPQWDFAFTDEERTARDTFFARMDRPALAVVVRTTKPEKNWIPERYARVLEIAEGDLGLRPVLVGSGAPAEMAAAREVERLTRARSVLTLGNDLRRLAWLLDGSALLLSPDTGPLHMGVALNTPTVGLFGYTDPKRVGPYRRFQDLVVDRYTRPDDPDDRGPSARVRPGGMARITVADVAEKLELAVRRHVPCARVRR